MNIIMTPSSRAVGAILGTAIGDALGAPYEFGATRPGVRLTGTAADMVGNHQWEPGEWTDDTSMAIPILEQLAQGEDLAGEKAQDAIVAAWVGWSHEAKDIGIQTRAVLHGLQSLTARGARASAQRLHDAHGRSGGNGSVMRTAPVGLAYLEDEDGLIKVAHTADAIAALTHVEADAREGAALWSALIHLVIRYGHVSLADALAVLPANRRDHWGALLAEAEGVDPDSFAHNGWVIHAMQAAWAALGSGGIRLDNPTTATSDTFVAAMNAAIDIHNDSDTVAAIAGGLAGAFVGADAIPRGWTERLHGWPIRDGHALTGADLVTLAMRATAHTPLQ